jgi:arylsulfatase A-like enzyme
MKRYILKAIAFVVLAFSFSSFNQKKNAPTRPNILIIFSDDHALKAISAYGSPHMKTPNIDRIAKDGAIFKNMFCTNSICGPSRATLLTGKFSHKNGHINNKTKFDTNQDIFPKHLQEAGYETGWIGKWHLVNLPKFFNYWSILPGQGSYYNPDFIEMDGQTRRQEGYASDIIAGRAIDWLQNKHDTAKPFCLIIGQNAPHRTWLPDTADLHAFGGVKFKMPDTFYDTYEGRVAAQRQKMHIAKDLRMDYDLKVDDNHLPHKKRMNEAQLKTYNAYYEPLNEQFKKQNLTGMALDEWKFQRYMHDYMASVKSLDRNIGKVLDYLDKNGLTENTLIVYASDQGFYLGEHGWFDKRFMYEESFHVPLVMKYPKLIKKGTVVNSFAQNIDFAPTFLELAGVNIPDDIQGKSLLPLLKNQKPASWRKSLYYHYYEYPDEHNTMPHFGVRTDRYKLIRFYDDGDFWELYDLKNDPKELKNIYASAPKALVNSLKQELKRLIAEYGDKEAAEILKKETNP